MTHLQVLPETRLHHGTLHAVLAPAAGGRISRLFSSDTATGQTIDWLVPLGDTVRATGFESTSWPKAGLYPLIPYSNRIQHGSFAWPGRTVQLALHPGERHALHGGSQQRPWTLTQHDASSATMTYVHQKNQDGWPWAYLAGHTVTLGHEGLTLHMHVTNADDAPMPCGIGFHPDFPSRFAHRVGFSAPTIWPPDAQFLGSAPRPAGAMDDYAEPREVADAELTQYYSEWNGSATLAAADGATIQMTASSPMQHLVLHRPSGAQYFCVEPVSHVSNAAHLAQQGYAGTGWQTLAPGQQLECRLRIQLCARDLS
jgi:aldose 1-epimerase